MSSSLGSLLTYLGGDSSGLERTLTNVQRRLQGVTRDVSSFGNRWNEVGGKLSGWNMLGPMLGMAGFTAMLTKSVNLAIDMDGTMAMLEESLARVGKYNPFNVKEVTDFATGLQKVVRTMDEEQFVKMFTSALNLSGQANLSLNQIKQQVTAAVGLAAMYRSMGLSAETALTIMGRAQQGVFMRLQRYGIVFAKGMTDQEKYNYLLKLGAQGFAMQDHYANTLPGLFKRMTIGLEEFLKEIGIMIVKGLHLNAVFLVMSEWLEKARNLIARLSPEQKTFISRLLLATVAVGAFALGFALVFKVLSGFFTLISAIASIFTMLFNPVTLVVGALMLLGGAAATAFGTSMPLAERFKNLLGDIWDMLSGNKKFNLSSLIDMFAPLIDMAQSLFDSLVNGIQNLYAAFQQNKFGEVLWAYMDYAQASFINALINGLLLAAGIFQDALLHAASMMDSALEKAVLRKNIKEAKDANAFYAAGHGGQKWFRDTMTAWNNSQIEGWEKNIAELDGNTDTLGGIIKRNIDLYKTPGFQQDYVGQGLAEEKLAASKFGLMSGFGAPVGKLSSLEKLAVSAGEVPAGLGEGSGLSLQNFGDRTGITSDKKLWSESIRDGVKSGMGWFQGKIDQLNAVAHPDNAVQNAPAAAVALPPVAKYASMVMAGSVEAYKANLPGGKADSKEEKILKSNENQETALDKISGFLETISNNDGLIVSDLNEQ